MLLHVVEGSLWRQTASVRGARRFDEIADNALRLETDLAAFATGGPGHSHDALEGIEPLGVVIERLGVIIGDDGEVVGDECANSGYLGVSSSQLGVFVADKCANDTSVGDSIGDFGASVADKGAFVAYEYAKDG